MKIGIEIHQRLDCKKLFCDCYCNPGKEDDGEVSKTTITRKMQAVVGETGKVDAAAAFEESKGQETVYHYSSDSACLVELDEEPPHAIREEALKEALHLALLAGANPVDEVFVMRKMIIDGSAVSSFQRTALVALGGAITIAGKTIGLQSICLEEDSAGIVKGKKKEFDLSRLGIPLIEIATAPEIENGKEAKETALALGTLLRSLRVQRGLGSIRQDVNVSIGGGQRVEIKGVQDLNSIEELIENERTRQEALVELQKELLERSAFSVGQIADATKLFENYSNQRASQAAKNGGRVFAFKIRGFAGFMKRELCKDLWLGRELSDYAIALGGGITHSDEAVEKKYFTQQETDSIANYLGCGVEDAWIICAGEAKTAKAALDAVAERVNRLVVGVLGETRRAENGVSRFMRPIPGSARMYPETDVQPIQITGAFLKNLSESLPKTLEEEEKELIANGLPADYASRLSKSPRFGDYKKLLLLTKASALDTAKEILDWSVQAKRNARKDVGFELEEDVLSLLAKKRITQAAVPEVLTECIKKGKTVREVLEENNWERIGGEELKTRVLVAKASNEQLNEFIRKFRLTVDYTEAKREWEVG
jgi:glutamyl-tRNA(Gln) amidotransferase subunit E